MDDTISRQAAIDAFGLSGKTRKYGGDHSGYNTLMLYEIQDIIEGLPSAQSEPRWIPIENEPPKEKKSYWVCTDTEYQCECRWTNNIYGLQESGNWGWSIFDIPQYTKVVAWMPLPEPFRGEENERT